MIRLRTPSTPRLRRSTLTLATSVAAALAVAAASQLLLPGLVRTRIADRLNSTVGTVRSLDISAAPAVKLLWGDADHIDVHLGTVAAPALRAGGGPRLARVPAFEAEIDELTTKLGDASDVRVRKSGDTFNGDLVIDPTAERTAGRGPIALTPEAGSDGDLFLELGRRGAANGRRLRLQVLAADGAIVARPDAVGGLVGTRTLFAPDELQFDSLRAAQAGSDIRVHFTGHSAS